MPYHKTAKEIIHTSNEQLGLEKWGFVIYRCTYTSQEKWDKFMALIKEDAKEYLQDENDQDLWQSIDWRVVENEEALGGNDWKEARSVFDAWVTSELKKETEEGREIRDWPDYLTESEKFRLRVKQAPHYRFFIFADEASVNSVVD